MTHTILKMIINFYAKYFLINNYLSKLKASFHLIYLKKEVKGFTQNLDLSGNS